MSLLLDTHVLLWLASDHAALGPVARTSVLTDEVFLSAINHWEIAIKQVLGRLDATGLPELLATVGFPELSLTSVHARAAGALPPHHRDPFDRALVAQARTEGLVLVSADHTLARYDVALLDASR